MQIGQQIRRFFSSIAKLGRFIPNSDPVVEVVDDKRQVKPARSFRPRKRLIIFGILGFIVLLWPVLAHMT